MVASQGFADLKAAMEVSDSQDMLTVAGNFH
jgi:hypothetical protein